MTDITELAQSLKAAATNVKETAHIARYLKATIARQTFIELMTPDNILALVEALEKSEKTSEARREAIDRTHNMFVRERDRANAAEEALEKAQTINAAAEKLVRCKGRYHSEQNYRALAALFGVKTPDLPPLEHENVHYADAAEMEIEALCQRIAELESRTVKLPPKIERNDADDWFMYNGGRVGGGAAEWYNKALDDVGAELTAAGIKVEAE